MEATRPSRAPSTDGEEQEYDPKARDVEMIDKNAPSEQDKGESSTYQAAVSCPQETPAVSKPAGNVVDMEVKLRRKIYECGLGDMRIPEMPMSGCSHCDQTESDEDDDDTCSTSSDDSDNSVNPLVSGTMPPVLPDIQLRVPMENEDDVQRVKDALLIKGVLDVVCDEERQIVTVTGTVPPSRLLKKVRRVKRQARILSTVSPFAVFVNPHFGSSAVGFHEEEDDDDTDTTAHTTAIDIPSSASPVVASEAHHHRRRARPTFQRYHFHNDPHSPYLRTFSLSDLRSPSSSNNSNSSSPSSSPSYVTGDAFDHHRRFDSSFVHDDLIL